MTVTVMTPSAKDYIITSPEGEQKVIRNLSQFCRDNNLDRSKMHKVARGAAKAHKGYQISRTMK